MVQLYRNHEVRQLMFSYSENLKILNDQTDRAS